jgi:hypothetical protein
VSVGNVLGDYISESDQKMGKVSKNKVEKQSILEMCWEITYQKVIKKWEK